jgi:DNA-binding SARP family transcriptional activator/Tfp pilus assembly protein PilF
MEFGVLGPLQVNGRDILLPAKQRVVLAVLLLRNNRIVPVEALVDALWDDAPPSSARTTLQGYIKQLRQNADAGAGGRLVTRPPGYLMKLGTDELDLDRFTRLCDRGRAAAAEGNWHGASDLPREALQLWRGDPLADVPSATVQQAEVPRLAELRIQAVESRITADLRLGRHAELVARLRQLTIAEPLREGLHGQLMLALYRCGRQAEALEVFRGIDRRLRGELGISPGPELRQLHQRLLAGDPTLIEGAARGTSMPAPAVEVPAPRPAAVTGSLPVRPAQLPPDTTDFTGRAGQVRSLSRLLGAPPSPDRPGAVVISAVAGMGGIGKTALAVHVAHRLRDRFPDGQLYVSLLGATRPLPPGEVLGRLLHDLGDLDEAIPAGAEERATRYRSLMTGRRVLIVLDDALDAAQVRPLLPGTAGCAVIVTSRSTLADLAGAAQLSLDAMDEEEARHLFAAIAGERRAAAEPEAMAEVLACCAGLPLAIRIAASRLASRPAWSVAQLGVRLAGERDRLAELAVGDLAVRASFAVSYHALPGGHQAAAGGADPARVFRLLGLPGMAELSLPAIAALTAQPAAQVAVALEALTESHLLQSPAPDRYRLHDLLRSYAGELAGQIDSQQERDAALSRLVTWYGEQTVIAARALAPGGKFPVIIPVPAAPAAPSMAGPAAAFAWFEAELAGVLLAARHAAGLARHDITAQIAMAVAEFLQRTPYNDTWLAISEAGVDSARRLGHSEALSLLLGSLGKTHSELSHFADASHCFTEALQIRRRTGDKAGEAMVFNWLAINLFQQGGQEERSLEHMRAALDLMDVVNNPSMTGLILNNTGHILMSVKRYDEALLHLERALAIQQGIDDDGYRRGNTESTLGQTYLELGRYGEAVRYCERALASFEGVTLGNHNRAEALACLGDALAHLGRAPEARDAWLAALAIYDQLGTPGAAKIRDQLAALI